MADTHICDDAGCDFLWSADNEDPESMILGVSSKQLLPSIYAQTEPNDAPRFEYKGGSGATALAKEFRENQLVHIPVQLKEGIRSTGSRDDTKLMVDSETLALIDSGNKTLVTSTAQVFDWDALDEFEIREGTGYHHNGDLDFNNIQEEGNV